MCFPLADNSVQSIKKQLDQLRTWKPKTIPQARAKALKMYKLTGKLAVAENP